MLCESNDNKTRSQISFKIRKLYVAIRI